MVHLVRPHVPKVELCSRRRRRPEAWREGRNQRAQHVLFGLDQIGMHHEGQPRRRGRIDGVRARSSSFNR